MVETIATTAMAAEARDLGMSMVRREREREKRKRDLEEVEGDGDDGRLVTDGHSIYTHRRTSRRLWHPHWMSLITMAIELAAVGNMTKLMYQRTMMSVYHDNMARFTTSCRSLFQDPANLVAHIS